MRNITFAIYKGIEYSAGIKKDGRIVLRSEDDASKKEGFVEKEIGFPITMISNGPGREDIIYRDVK